jgi:hypothetical protein
MPRPPLALRWILRLLLGPEDLSTILGDLDELYRHRRGRDGERAAAIEP